MIPSDTLKLRVNKVAGSQRNFTLHITGVVLGEMPLTPIDVDSERSQLKLASLAWLIQEKMGLYLSWDKQTIMLPMESRNAIRFDTSIKAPDGWNGRIWLSSFGYTPPQKVFFLVLDFDK